MDPKENKLYYFIQLELLRLKNLTNIFGEEQSRRYSVPLKITSSAHGVVWRAQDPRLVL